MFSRQLCWDVSAAVEEANTLVTNKFADDPGFDFASVGITSDDLPLTLADLQKEATYQHAEDFYLIANQNDLGVGEARTLAGSAYG